MKVQTSAQLKCFDRILIELRMNQFNCTYIMPNDNKDIPMPTNLNELKQLFKEEFGIQTGVFFFHAKFLFIPSADTKYLQSTHSLEMSF